MPAVEAGERAPALLSADHRSMNSTRPEVQRTSLQWLIVLARVIALARREAESGAGAAWSAACGNDPSAA